MRLGRKPIAIATTASIVATRMAAASISTSFSVAQSPRWLAPCAKYAPRSGCGVPDQALAWQIAERYIELVRQQHPYAALYAVRQTDSPWEPAITTAGAMTRITGWAIAGTRMGVAAALAVAAGCVAVRSLKL